MMQELETLENTGNELQKDSDSFVMANVFNTDRPH